MRTNVLHPFAFALALAASAAWATDSVPPAPIGAPIPGLTAEELALFNQGKVLFEHEFTPSEGLGPTYNARACSTCHASPVTGGSEATTANNVIHFTLNNQGNFMQAFEFGGPVMQKLSIKGDPQAPMCNASPDTVPMMPGVGQSPRHTPAVFGFGLIDAISDHEIQSFMGRRPWKDPAVIGVPNYGVELEGLGRLNAFTFDTRRTQVIGPTRVGRFGWKAQTATLFQFSNDPFNIELGVTSPFFPRENSRDGTIPGPECDLIPGADDADGQQSLRLLYFQAFIAPPSRGPITPEVIRGETVFHQAGCAGCHRPKMKTAKDYYVPWPDGTAHRVAALSDKWVELYSDLLIHDMGPLLEDPRPMGAASGRFWRTTPLWGLRTKSRFLHDGSAVTIDDAVAAHGGEGTASRARYFGLSAADKSAISAFLESL